MRISKISQHVGVLERRATYLRARLDGGRLEPQAAAFEHRELRAVEAGIHALTRVRHYERPETSPVVALEALLDALEDEPGLAHLGADLHLAIARSNAVLSMMQDLDEDVTEVDRPEGRRAN